MSKFVLLVLVLVAAWMLLSRTRRVRPPPPPAPKPPAQADAGATRMVACVHCGLHLPQAEAQQDGTGREYCSEAHRLAGPRADA